MNPSLLNDWRVVPRIAICMYGIVCWEVAGWFMALPDPSNAQSAFVSVIWGAAAAWFNFYVKSGNSNDKSNTGSSGVSSDSSGRVGRIQQGSGHGEE